MKRANGGFEAVDMDTGQGWVWVGLRGCGCMN